MESIRGGLCPAMDFERLMDGWMDLFASGLVEQVVQGHKRANVNATGRQFDSQSRKSNI